MSTLCYPCNNSDSTNARRICQGCVLSPIFSNQNRQDFEQLLHYHGASIVSLKQKLCDIPPCLRKAWVALKPLMRPNLPVRQSALSWRDCYPCWRFDPDLGCVGCPLGRVFNEKNILDFEILLVSHGGNLSELKEKFKADISDELDWPEWVELKKLEIDLEMRNLWAKDADGLNNKGKKVLEGEVGENPKVDGEGVGRKVIRFIMKGKGKEVMNDQHGADMVYPIEKEKEKEKVFEAKDRLEQKIAKKEAKLEHIEFKIAKSEARRQRIKNRIVELKQCRTDLE